MISHTYAHEGNRTYPIVELTDADLALIDLQDGSVEEWLTIVGEPTLTAFEFFALSRWEPYDPSDMNFRLWLAWHDRTNRIYAAMERSDDIYINTYDRNNLDWNRGNTSSWNQDSSISLALDGDHSGGPYARLPCCYDDDPTQALEYARQVQRYSAIAESGHEAPHVYIDILQNLNPGYPHGTWYVRPPYAEGGGGHFGDNPVISVTEFYVTPFDHMVWSSEEESLVSELSPGKTIGFELRVTDRDDENESISAFFSLPDLESLPLDQGSSADFFLDGLLLGPGGAIPEVEDTAVESITWGRIKVTFD